jgi:hypothetical protein
MNVTVDASVFVAASRTDEVHTLPVVSFYSR